MGDYLVEWMQALCIIGLIWGAYLSATGRREHAAVWGGNDPVALPLRDVSHEIMPRA